MTGISGKGTTLFGNDVLLQVLRLLANPSELQARIEMLAEAERAADAKISAVGPADEIMRMREDLRVELEEAKRARAMALEENAKIVADAKATANELIESARGELLHARATADKTVSEAESKMTAAREFEAHLDQRNEHIGAVQKLLDEQTAELEKEREEIAAARAENTAERDRLAKISARLQEALQ